MLTFFNSLSPFVQQTTERLGWVLVHSLWQFAVIAILAAVVARMLRRSSSILRYAFLIFSMGLIVAAPIVTGVVLPVNTDVNASNREALTPEFTADASATGDDPEFAAGRSSEMPVVPSPGERQGVSPPSTTADSTPELTAKENTRRADAQPLASRVADALRPWMTFIVAFWAIGVLLCSLRPLLGWRTLRRLRSVGISVPSDEVLAAFTRVSKRLGVKRAVQVFNSTLAKGPLVVGYLRPIVLLPVSFATSIPMPQLEAILAHELAHIRRHDFVINLLQTLVETLFFYHPAVWWLSHRIRIEREHCCDDLVIKLFNNAPDYGRALLAVEQLQGQTTSLALGAKDGSLLGRIRRIVSPDSNNESGRSWLVLPLIICLCSVTTIVAVNMRSAVGVEEKTEDAVPVSAIAELPEGIRVEFLGLAAMEDNPKQWWTPNGAKLSAAPAYQLGGTVRVVDAPLRRALFQVHGLGDDATAVSANMSGERRIEQLASGEKVVVFSGGLQIQPGKQTASLRVGVATDPLSPVRILEANGQRRPTVANAPVDRVAEDIVVKAVKPLSGGNKEVDGKLVPVAQTELDFETPTAWRQPDLEIVAIDKEGNSHRESGGGGGYSTDANAASTGMTEGIVMFPLPPEQIDRFEYQFRIYRHWAAFENVAMDAGKITEVTITTDSLPSSKPNNIAKLPDGIEVELIGVVHYPSKEKKWWHPDGTELVQQLDVSELGALRIPGLAETELKAREFLLQIRGLPRDHSVRTDYTAGATSRRPSFKDGIWTGYDGALPFEDEPMAIKLCIATEPFGPLMTIDLKGTKDKDIQIPENLRSLYDHVVPLEVAERSDQTVLRIENTMNANLFEVAECEFYAVDLKGSQHLPSTKLIMRIGPRELAFVLPLSGISHFEYRVRRYRHFVTFENVSLEPGQKSDVTVSVKSLPSDAVQAFIPNGPMIQLLGVSTPPIEMPSKDKREWWSGAGKLLDVAPVQPGSLRVSPEHSDGREFAVRLSGCQSKPITHVSLVKLFKNGQPVDMPKNGQSMSSTHGSQAPEFGCTIESVHWPIGDADAATVQVKFGEAPVVLVKFDANGKRIADADVDAALQNSSCQQLLDGVKILRTGPHEDGFAVWSNPFSSSTDLGSIDLTLIDKSGNELRPFGSSGNGTENIRSFKVPPADVAAIAIRLQPYTHVATFENVSLKAGKQTAVKVSIELLTAPSGIETEVRGF